MLEVGHRAGRVFSYERAKKEEVKKVSTAMCVYACVWVFSSAAHPEYMAAVLVVSLTVDTHTLKPSKANSFTRVSSFSAAVLKL